MHIGLRHLAATMAVAGGLVGGIAVGAHAATPPTTSATSTCGWGTPMAV